MCGPAFVDDSVYDDFRYPADWRCNRIERKERLEQAFAT